MNLLLNIRDSIIESQRAYYEYLKEEERLETKRVAVIASIEQLTELIKVKREVSEMIAKQYWREKEYLRNLCEKALQKFIDLADFELADIHIHFIDVLYSENPFEKMRKLF